MKRSFIILVLMAGLTMQAQDWKRGLAIAGYHTATVVLGAVADGLYDNGNKEWGHALQVAELGAIAGGVFIFKPDGLGNLGKYFLSYAFIRFSFFDSFYNATRGLPVLYNGTTSWYDKTMSQIPPHGRAWMKSCSLIVGIAIPIKEIK